MSFLSSARASRPAKSSTPPEPVRGLTRQANEPRSLRSVLPSPSPVFVAACMVVIAGSLAMVLYLRAGLGLAEAGWIGFAALMVMILAEFFSARSREKAAVERQLREVNGVSAALQNQIEGLTVRVTDLETMLTVRIEAMIDERVSGLEDEVAELKAANDSLREEFDAGKLARPAHPPAISMTAFEAQIATPEKPALAPSPFEGLDDAASVDRLKRCIVDRGPDILLQPVVSLPQRQVRFHEALCRLRDDERTLRPDQFIPFAERTGVMPILDNAVLYRSVQIIQKMARNQRGSATFCNVSTQTLSDSSYVEQFVGLLSDNTELSQALVLEFRQADFAAMGPVEISNLEALAERGLRFSVDTVNSLDLDCATMADRKVRYVKIDASLLLDPALAASANIHAADIAALLARYGIELIVTRIETEAQVIDLLDYDVKFGQGTLFSPPKPVRID